MKDFEKIDWEQFSRPPYLQEWLRKDDTHKLFTFGDKGLGEVDDQIMALKDLWDLDSVAGHYLDRIGKLLSEKRNGNTDEYYRILLKLRRLLNTNDGTIPSIIKAIKFIYSSEIVHIVPNYPAGLIIEHDGEGTTGLNFNRLLTEVIPAGVSFSTKELFYFKDELFIRDELDVIRGEMNFVDTFRYGVLKFNGRVKHDGVTVNPYEYEGVKADGKYKFDGTIKHSPVLVPGRSEVIFPLKARSGISDRFEITIGTGNCDDIFTSRLKHDGRIKADGSHKFNGETVPGDSAIEMNANLSFDDKVSVTDYFPMTVHETLVDHFSTHYKFDGTFRHDGTIKAGAARDEFISRAKIGAMTDTVQITDGFFVGMRKFAKHDGRYKADGKIKFNSGIRVPV